MTRDDTEALCDQLTYRPVGTTAAQMREAAAALREQQAELDENRKRFATMARVGLQHESEIVRLAAELAECRRDAERYRWIRQSTADIEGPAAYAPWCGPPLFDAALDAATDAAIDAARKEGK